MGRRGRYIAMGALVAAVAGGLLHERRTERQASGPRATVPAAAVAPPRQATPDVLYTWVDRHGVTHYEQRPVGKGRGERVQYDGSRVTPLPPVDPGLATRLRDAAGSAAPQGVVEGAAGAATAAASGLHGLRLELQQGAQQMQAAQSASRADL